MPSTSSMRSCVIPAPHNEKTRTAARFLMQSLCPVFCKSDVPCFQRPEVCAGSLEPRDSSLLLWRVAVFFFLARGKCWILCLLSRRVPSSLLDHLKLCLEQQTGRHFSWCEVRWKLHLVQCQLPASSIEYCVQSSSTVSFRVVFFLQSTEACCCVSEPTFTSDMSNLNFRSNCVESKKSNTQGYDLAFLLAVRSSTQILSTSTSMATKITSVVTDDYISPFLPLDLMM